MEGLFVLTRSSFSNQGNYLRGVCVATPRLYDELYRGASPDCLALL